MLLKVEYKKCKNRNVFELLYKARFHTVISDDGLCAKVVSGNSAELYTVWTKDTLIGTKGCAEFANKESSCSCKYGAYHRGPSAVCSHVLAVYASRYPNASFTTGPSPDAVYLGDGVFMINDETRRDPIKVSGGVFR
jgi:hypothetical protein